MPNFGYDPSDEDMITCEYCGHRDYPQIGPGGHFCAEGAKAARERSENWERRYKAGGKRVRYTIVVECYDSHDSISHAIGSADSEILCNTKAPFGVGEDDILATRFAFKREELR